MAALCPQMGMVGAGQQAPPPYPGLGQVGQPAIQQPSTPMFVSPPPKPQRLLHSEAYLKYIEGLRADSSTISKWDQTLSGKFSLHDRDLTPSNIELKRGIFLSNVSTLWMFVFPLPPDMHVCIRL